MKKLLQPKALIPVILSVALAVSTSFSLAFSLIVPIPVDIGVLEVSGVGAFLAIGIQGGKSAAVGAVLINRVLSIIASLAIAALVMLIFHGEFRAVLRGRSTHTQQDDAERTQERPATSEASGA